MTAAGRRLVVSTLAAPRTCRIRSCLLRRDALPRPFAWGRDVYSRPSTLARRSQLSLSGMHSGVSSMYLSCLLSPLRSLSNLLSRSGLCLYCVVLYVRGTRASTPPRIDDVYRYVYTSYEQRLRKFRTSLATRGDRECGVDCGVSVCVGIVW